MKILHLIYDDRDNPWLGGGAAVRTYEIYRRLAKRHDITVVTGNYSGAKSEEKEGITYKRIGSGKNYILSRLTFLKGIHGAIKMDHDILIEDFSAPFPYFSPLYTKRPVIALVQMIFSPLYFRKRPFLAAQTILLQKLGFRYYDNFVAVSDSVSDKIHAWNKNASVCVIPNGIDARNLFYLTDERDYILYLGRIDYYDKGLDVLIKAFKNIAKTYPVRLVIAGGGRSKEIRKVDGSIQDNSIDIIGKVDGEKKNEYMGNCLFFCIPSRNEASPVVALEAFSFGKPIIATDVGGLPKIVRQSGAGVLVKSGDVDSLTMQMSKLLENTKLRKELGSRGRNFATNYTWEEITKRQEEYYKKVLDQG